MDFVTPVLILTQGATIVVLNTWFILEPGQDKLRINQTYLYFVLYIMTSFYTSISFIPHLLCRVASTSTFFYVQINRLHNGDPFDFHSSFIFLAVIILLFETNAYLTHRSKAMLYLEIMVN